MALTLNNLIGDFTGFPVFSGGGPRLLGFATSDDIDVENGNLSSFPWGVWGLDGNDTIAGSSDSNERLLGNNGDDIIGGGGGNDIIYGGKGNDGVDGNDGNDVVRGDSGNDLIFGGAGNDILRGGQGDDDLEGNDGNDFLAGDRGIDVLTGGLGADIFILRSNEQPGVNGADVITDFNFDEGDRIGLTDGLTELDLIFTDDNLIAYDNDGIINDMVIENAINGQIVGIVLNTNNFELIGAFEPASPFALAVNGSQFQFLA
ncbi:MAG: calcium-binding protein [Microcoleus sp. PH2017_29_MFU_D_A]|uniref:calcium-binding protein n=1 Tax=unclassified Microcoleus TaxID=2642155 RepID=UPI001D643596|nr:MULTISPECIES: calcium-binding protein [unclassified Microcoleus]MCC3417818.1 calcium-binding protein [Microcoleus sp. PH2017_07_MST_O_A]MCC3429730.1 calcium-binding protein [Microcoleus sp. PH2017_04_SCI_O_A]MCC3441817.1 calcium-binding protein [Microcoleus sp. PH2017_03_ELD_O_A]MCC3501861.1 calcium-binding protein [Microcoleus sp. PH2017_19_SFW_U_A]MCC3507945.1 calcium-binding protein [Microcoleus sp. PH2017_17_BER_D_A]TAE09276.1 MAG: calcium-binding protein [Oscillatoriales cyanobacteriu